MATAVICGPFSAWGCQEIPVLPPASTTTPPLRLGQPLSPGTPGWSLPPPPQTSPDAFPVSPQGREGQG